MEIKTHSDADSFLHIAQTHLEQHEVENSLMLGTCLRLRQFPDLAEQTPYLATVQEGDRLMAAAIMTPPHNLVVHSDSDAYAAAFALVAQNLRDGGWTVPSVSGPVHLARAFAERWARYTGASYSVVRQMRVFELRQVIHRRAPNGHLRLATEDDIDLLTAWRTAFGLEALGADDAADSRAAVTWAVQHGNIYIWDDDGPVSIAAKSRPTTHGITVNLVYTPPELRGRSYATACVASLSQLLLDQGWQFCTLFTDLANPTSNRIYQQIGYKAVCDFTEYWFGST